MLKDQRTVRYEDFMNAVSEKLILTQTTGSFH